MCETEYFVRSHQLVPQTVPSSSVFLCGQDIKATCVRGVRQILKSRQTEVECSPSAAHTPCPLDEGALPSPENQVSLLSLCVHANHAVCSGLHSLRVGFITTPLVVQVPGVPWRAPAPRVPVPAGAHGGTSQHTGGAAHRCARSAFGPRARGRTPVAARMGVTGSHIHIATRGCALRLVPCVPAGLTRHSAALPRLSFLWVSLTRAGQRSRFTDSDP